MLILAGDEVLEFSPRCAPNKRKLRDDGYIVEPIQGKSSVSRKRLSADGYEFVVIAGSGDVPERLVPQVDRPPASA